MNIAAIIIGAVINMIVGWLWYSPVLFAKPWLKLIGKTKKELKKSNMGMMYGITLIMSLVLSYMLMYFITMLGITGFTQGALLGITLWFGFVATTTISDYVFSGRPLKLYAINIGYYLVVLTLVGAFFGVWH